MDNTIIPYENVSGSSDEELSDSSSNDEHSYLLSNNIGVLFNKFNTDNTTFMNMEDPKEYAAIRNKYYTPEITKVRLMIESKNIKHNEGHNTSDYKIHFNENSQNSSSGYGSFDNVIGFRLIRANIFNSSYTVTDNNKNIQFFVNDHPYENNLVPGNYTVDALGTHLQDILNNAFPGVDEFSVTQITNPVTYKYNIKFTGAQNTHGQSFKINWKSSGGAAYRLFGFLNIDPDPKSLPFDTETSVGEVISDNVVQQSVHYVDLVIPEIPYIACKRNSIGKHLIDRIPLDQAPGTIVNYSSDINSVNYFNPINLNSLTIQLYEDTSELLYQCQNNDNSFEVELTILNKNV
jgi:hypothetical protein